MYKYAYRAECDSILLYVEAVDLVLAGKGRTEIVIRVGVAVGATQDGSSDYIPLRTGI